MKTISSKRKNRVLVVGGGNAAHAFVARCGSLGMDVDWLTTYGQESEKISLELKKHGGVIAIDSKSGEKWHGLPQRISNNPEILVPDCGMIILTLPAQALPDVLNGIAPYVEEETCIGVLPGYPSLDIIMRDAFGVKKLETLTYFGTRTLPWACRVIDYGKSVSIFGTKAKDQIVISNPKNKLALSVFQEIAGRKIRYETVNNFLFLSFTMPWHPCFFYGMFKNWDGVSPYPKVPTFYRSVSKETADLISETSDEVLKLKNKITEICPSIDLSLVAHVKDWFRQTYGSSIPVQNLNDLHSMITSNPTYNESLVFPMQTVDGGYIPDFTSRYLTEDVPCVLAVHLGISEMMGLSIPRIRHLVEWCQMAMQKEYLIGGKLLGKDISETRAPQKYGFSDFYTFAKEMGYI